MRSARSTVNRIHPASNLEVLRKNIQEVIGLVLDRPEDEVFDVWLVFDRVDSVFLEAAAVGAERVELERKQTELAERTVQAAQRLTDAGWSVRDIGGALQITPGRVSQIVGAKRAS